MTPRRLLFRLKEQTGGGVDAGQGTPRIRCPQCGYVPRKDDRWMCREGCRHVWNTFDTRGVCPACKFAWQETACPRCGQWSAHADWYTDGKE